MFEFIGKYYKFIIGLAFVILVVVLVPQTCSDLFNVGKETISGLTDTAKEIGETPIIPK